MGDECGRTLVIIPTYNEATTVEALLEAVLAAETELAVLVVDDASPDGTGKIADARAASVARVHVLHRDSKQGLGRAYLAGFAWGMSRGFERFVEMDADGSHDPATIPALVAATDECDLAIGSRYVSGGGIVGWSRGRQLLSRMGNAYARVALRLPVADSTSGFRCYRRSLLESVDLGRVRSEGYAFQIDIVYRAWRLGSVLKEIPIVFRERAQGQSKMSSSIVLEAVASVTAWGLRDALLGRRWRRPRVPVRR